MSVIPRAQHIISRKNISKNALKVLYRLNRAGYEAYLVGGGVRDLLLRKIPKDFDVTTSATPEQIRKLFRNCRLIGRRFRLAHVIFGLEVIEVATFRGHREEYNINYDSSHHGKNGILLSDNIFGSIKEDAKRRDFTINSLYYSVVDFAVRDYVGGMQDLKKGIIRLIGNPEIRYREDPVRMLRAICFSAKLCMGFSPKTAEPISRLAGLINNVSPARLFEEAIKILQTGYSYNTYKLLCEYNLFQSLFPTTVQYFTESGNSPMERMISQVFRNIDQRTRNDIYANIALMFAAIFWYPLVDTTQNIAQKYKMAYYNAFILATNNILNEACRTLVIPKRITTLVRDIWKLQLRIPHYFRNQAWNILENSRLHVAYDLLSLRARSEKNQKLQKLVQQLSELQNSILLKQKEKPNNPGNDLKYCNHHNFRDHLCGVKIPYDYCCNCHRQ